MTTNAYRLDGQTFSRLTQLGVREYQITFDGPRSLHDTKRLRIGGQGSFDRIWDNLRTAQRSPESFTILVRVHIDEEDRESIDDFLEQFRESFGTDSRFRIHLRKLSRPGASRDAPPVLDRDHADPAVREGRRLAAARGLNLTSFTEADCICYASRANAFVVRSDGTLGKCTVALSHANNAVGRIFLDGSLVVDDAKVAGWMRGLWSGDEIELACPRRGYAETAASGCGRV